jgi:hypothetical protein
MRECVESERGNEDVGPNHPDILRLAALCYY